MSIIYKKICQYIICVCFSDFEDTSPEELRHLAYEAQKSNTFQGYVSKPSTLLFKSQCSLQCDCIDTTRQFTLEVKVISIGQGSKGE